jgi:D-tyrosyl-tRNA(Tyr) deacylase
MIAVVQRVLDASVIVSGVSVGAIENGCLVYLGVAAGDGEDDAHYVAEKVVNLRIFSDAAGKMNLSLLDLHDNGEAAGVLAVSQFTLLGDVRKGRRPSFNRAEQPERANELFEEFVSKVSSHGIPVNTGVFGAHMEVAYVNDGPVTLIIESPASA